MKFLSVVLCLMLLSIHSFGQATDFILLKRGAKQKSQLRFYPGEEITYKSKKLGYFVTDVIKNVDDNFIYLNENILSPENILEIDIRDKDSRNSTLRNLNSIVLGAGVILLGVESINSVYHDQSFSISKGVGITSGILLGTGLAMLPIRYKTFKNEGRNHIQIIRMRMD